MDVLDGYKPIAEQSLFDWLDQQANALKGRRYPRTEEATWTAQERGARALLADADGGDEGEEDPEAVVDVDYVRDLAAAQGRTDEQMAQAIIVKATLFRRVSLAITNTSNAGRLAIAAASTIEEVDQAVAAAQAAFLAALTPPQPPAGP